jgi:hypothetical protein
LLDRLEPEQLLTVGLPVWWLMLLPGKPANLCLEGGFVLREAFALFGIEAEVKLVELFVHNNATGDATQYGRPEAVHRRHLLRARGTLAAGSRSHWFTPVTGRAAPGPSSNRRSSSTSTGMPDRIRGRYSTSQSSQSAGEKKIKCTRRKLDPRHNHLQRIDHG